MAGITRRDMVKVLASASVAASFSWTEDEIWAASELAQAARAATAAPYTPKFFTAHEYETVRTLADMIIPRDERSGSATDVGVPEFIDFMMREEPTSAEDSLRQTSMRGGLAWLDLECQRRHDKTFAGCSATERAAVLDDISWPVREQPPGADPPVPDFAPGRAFFFSFRDLTASGFWTSREGMADLQYMGNRVVAEWTGCPDAAMKELGVG